MCIRDRAYSTVSDLPPGVFLFWFTATTLPPFSRTDTDGVLDVIYAAPDFRYAKNRRFSIQMRQDENGGYFIASLPQEIE